MKIKIVIFFQILLLVGCLDRNARIFESTIEFIDYEEKSNDLTQKQIKDIVELTGIIDSINGITYQHEDFIRHFVHLNQQLLNNYDGIQQIIFWGPQHDLYEETIAVLILKTKGRKFLTLWIHYQGVGSQILVSKINNLDFKSNIELSEQEITKSNCYEYGFYVIDIEAETKYFIPWCVNNKCNVFNENAVNIFNYFNSEIPNLKEFCLKDDILL